MINIQGYNNVYVCYDFTKGDAPCISINGITEEGTIKVLMLSTEGNGVFNIKELLDNH